MTINRKYFLNILLYLGSAYYLVGAITHFFGLTLFPFYDGALYAPYHDTVIALVAVIFSLLLFKIARNPAKNIDALNVMIIGGVIAIIFSLWIIWRIDFTALGAPAKKLQTLVEAGLLFIYVILLAIFRPKT